MFFYKLDRHIGIVALQISGINNCN